MAREGKAANKWHIIQQVTPVAKWGSVPRGTFCCCRARAGVIPAGGPGTSAVPSGEGCAGCRAGGADSLAHAACCAGGKAGRLWRQGQPLRQRPAGAGASGPQGTEVAKAGHMGRAATRGSCSLELVMFICLFVCFKDLTYLTEREREREKEKAPEQGQRKKEKQIPP